MDGKFCMSVDYNWSRVLVKSMFTNWFPVRMIHPFLKIRHLSSTIIIMQFPSLLIHYNSLYILRNSIVVIYIYLQQLQLIGVLIIIIFQCQSLSLFKTLFFPSIKNRLLSHRIYPKYGLPSLCSSSSCHHPLYPYLLAFHLSLINSIKCYATMAGRIPS